MKILQKIPLLLPLLAVVAGIVLFKKPVGVVEVPARDTACEGVVVEADRSGDRQRLLVEVSLVDDGMSATKPTPFGVALTMPFFHPSAEVGDIVRFSGTYTPATADTDLPLENDYYDATAYRGIALRCFVPISSFNIIGRSGNPLYAFGRWRTRLVDCIAASRLDDVAKALLAAILAGDDTYITDEMRSDFAAAGVAHVLALSGAHLAVIILLLAWALWPLRAAGHRRAAWALTVAGIWLFALLTGLSPSVTRSAIMATGVLVAYILDRPRSSLNLLCLAALLILLFSPFSLYRPGFQLSFLATLAIILCVQRPLQVPGRRAWLGWLVGTVGVTLAATVGTLPLVAYLFHRVPLYFLATNIVAVVLFPPLIFSGVVFLALLAVGLQPDWLVAVVDFLAGLLNGVAGAVASLPLASVEAVYFPAWLLVPAYLAVAALFAAYLRRDWRWLAASAALVGLTVGLHYAVKPVYPAEELYITREKHYTNVIVRRGDTLHVLTTDREQNLGPDSLYIARRYADFIASRGVRTVEIASIDSAAQPVVGFDGRTIRFSQYSEPEGHTDYCLVTRGFRGDIIECWVDCNADTLLLATDIHKRRRERYARELSEAGIPFRNLADAPLVLIKK